MWISEPGIRFRIMSSAVDKMFCEGTGETNAGHLQLGECGSRTDYNYYDGSWWTLERSRAFGYYLFVHLTTNRRLYVNGDRKEQGLAITDYQYDDQLWKFVARNDNSDDFQMVSCDQCRKLFFRNESDHIGVIAGNSFDYPDQFFHFFFEEPTVKSVNFMVNSFRTLGKCRKLLTQETFQNRSSVTQHYKTTAAYTQTKSHRWSYTGGFKISAEMKITFRTGIPLFGEVGSGFSLGVETSHKWTTEDVTTESKSMEYELSVTVPPNKAATAKIVIHEEEGEVPYEMILEFSGCRGHIVSRGKWRGVQCVNVDRHIVETNL